MTSKKYIRYYFYLLIGLAILAAGAVFAKLNRDAQDIMASFPYLLIGIGSGIFGQNLGTIIKLRSYAKHPDQAKLAAIEQNDERNVMLRNKAKASAFDVMIYTFGALMLSYALFNAELYVILSIVGAYLFVIGTEIFFLNKYNKEL